MNVVLDVTIIVVLFAVFGYIHSLLASEKIKFQFKNLFGDLIAFYRLLYNVFALISL